MNCTCSTVEKKESIDLIKTESQAKVLTEEFEDWVDDDLDDYCPEEPENMEPPYDEASAALEQALMEMEVPVITYKDYDADFQAVLAASKNALEDHGLSIVSQTIYLAEKECFALHTVLRHKPTGEYSTLLTKIWANNENEIEFKKAVTVARLFNYINILKMPYKNEMPDFMSELDPNLNKAIHISPTDFNLHSDCERCFYIKKLYNLGLSYDQEKFNFDNANDIALKQESDVFRKLKKVHPLFKRAGVFAIPFPHEIVKIWQSYPGIEHHDKEHNFVLNGRIDDVFLNHLGELVVIEHKTVTYDVDLNKNYGLKWRRQVAIYAYLLKLKGYSVCPKAYFIINKVSNKASNSDTLTSSSDPLTQNLLDAPENYRRLTEFDTKVIGVNLDFSWIEETLDKMKILLTQKAIPRIAVNRRENKVCPNCDLYAKTKVLEQKLKNEQESVK